MKIYFRVIDKQDHIIDVITSTFNYLPDEDELIDLCDEFVEKYREVGAVDCEWREVE